jgi:hypothetical protein
MMKTRMRKGMAMLVALCMLIIMMPVNVFATFAPSDITGHWAETKIQNWINDDLIAGYPDGTFKPQQNISRAEFMRLVNVAFDYTEVDTIAYTDVQPGLWYYSEVAKAKAAGYIVGYDDGTMKPENPINREEAAKIISTVKDLASDAATVSNYSDKAVISDGWGKDYVGAVTTAGIMKGYPDDSFMPKGNITRAEAVFALDNALNYTPTVYVSSPAYCSNISGDTTISIVAPNLTSATVKCWQSGDTYGSDSTVGTVTLDGSGNGSIVFPANSYPHGPLNIKITGTNGSDTNVCSLQVYNTSGTVWNQGIPSATPAAAEGMSLVFSDDFNTMPSISSTGADATYAAHKPGGGDFSSIPFADPTGPGNPFSQVDSYLRIRTSATLNTAGLISALRADGTGVTATAPCYFECRFIAQNAIGTWPAFWLMTKDVYKGLDVPADELDTIEGYGIEDPNHGNYKGYWVASHTWNQGEGPFPYLYRNFDMTTLGGGANWHQTFHTYGTKITLTDTIYYMDNIEVGRHASTPLSISDPYFFFINNATGGGWPVDLSRYNGLADMYVDWVRVYK